MTVQNRYIATVVKRAESSDATVQVDVLPTDTSITSGYITAIKSSPLSNVGVFIEELKFTGTDNTGGVLTLTGLLRGLREYGADTEVAANKKTLPAGTILIMGPNQHITNNKANLDSPNTFTGDQTISGGNLNLADTYGLSSDSDNIRIYRDGDDWKFVDNNQAVRTLSELASLSGSNDKIKISALDTTEGYGAAKLLGGDGISATDSGAGNSTLAFAVDLSATPYLEFSGGKLQVKIEDILPTGLTLPFAGTTAPTGWILLNGDTIGDTGSGATKTGSAYEDLYTHLWDNFADAQCAVSTGRGASAAADWAAGKTLTILDSKGKTMVGKDSGTFGTLGDTGGTETTTLTAAQSGLPAHNHSIQYQASSGGGSLRVAQSSLGTSGAFSDDAWTTWATQAYQMLDNASAPAGSAHTNLQPWLALNYIIKL
jgi:hypothetical protein